MRLSEPRHARSAFPRLRPRLLPALLFPLLVAVPPAIAGDPSIVAEHLEAARQLQEEGRLPKARRELDRADRAAAGASSEVAAASARLALAENDLQTALSEAKRALDLSTADPERATAWTLAGRIRLAAARHHEAAAEQVRATRYRRGSDRPADEEREHDAASREELDRAEEALSRALELAPSREAHVKLARVHFRRGELERARAELMAAGAAGEADDDEAALRACLDPLHGETKVYEISGAGAASDVVPPEKLEAEPPQFRDGPARGDAVIRGVIDPSGAMVCLEALVASDIRIARAALDALRGWRFEPASRGGEPVPVHYTVSFSYVRN